MRLLHKCAAKANTSRLSRQVTTSLNQIKVKLSHRTEPDFLSRCSPIEYRKSQIEQNAEREALAKAPQKRNKAANEQVKWKCYLSQVVSFPPPHPEAM